MGSTQPPPSGMQTSWRQIPPDAEPPGHVTCDPCWKANPSGQKNNCEKITLPIFFYVITLELCMNYSFCT